MVTAAGKKGPHRYASLSRAERQAARREDFLAAGIEIVGAVGIADTKVLDVCRRAGLTERFFYESFPNLHGFVRAVVETVAARAFSQIAEAATRESEPRAMARAGLTELVAILDEQPGVGRILMVETFRTGGELAALRAAVLTSAADIMRAWFGQPEELDLGLMVGSMIGQLRQADEGVPGLATSTDPGAVAIAGAMSEILGAWLAGRLALSADELVEHLYGLVDLTAGLPAAPAPRRRSPAGKVPKPRTGSKMLMSAPESMRPGTGSPDPSSPRAKRAHRYPGLSKEDRMAARREDFVQAGIEVIGTAGIQAMKLHDVCAAADLTQRYFYESFPNLEAFAKAVMETISIRMALRVFEATMSAPDVRDRAKVMLSEMVAILDEDPRLGRILLVETVRGGGPLADLRSSLLVGGANVLRLWINDPADVDLLETVGPLVGQFLGGEEIAADLVAQIDVGAVAMVGATVELLVAWLEGRLVMTKGEVDAYLLRLSELTLGLPPDTALA